MMTTNRLSENSKQNGSQLNNTLQPTDLLNVQKRPLKRLTAAKNATIDWVKFAC